MIQDRPQPWEETFCYRPMLQNVPRSVTAHQLQKSLDQRGWTGGFNYVHLPTRFGVKLAAWEVNIYTESLGLPV